MNRVVVCVLACIAGAAAQAQTITVLPNLPGGTFISVDAISDDGNVLCGDGTITGGAIRAWRWTAAAGMTNLGTIAGAGAGTDSYGYGMSGDGQVVVGATGAAYDVAHRWTSMLGMQSLGSLSPGQPSFAFDASFDGSVISGDGYSAAGQRAFRWTSTGGLQALTQLLPGTAHSVGLSVSANGGTIVGYCYNNAPALVYPTACRWDAAGAITSLGVLPGSVESVPGDVNADGSVVVGYCAAGTGGNTRAFRWTAAGGMQDLGFPPGAADAVASALTSDGATVVGYSSATGAWIWLGSGAPRDLATELQSRGISVAGWQLSTVTISADGSALAGTGLLNGVLRGWHLRIAAGCTNAPAINTQPQSQSVAAGLPVSFAVSASGGTLSFQWYKNAGAIAGAVGAAYSIPAVSASDAGTYSCVVGNACGSTPSSVATLVVTAGGGGGCGPTITTQPVSATVPIGQTAHFSLVATSSTTLNYQWRKNSVNIPGANDNTLAIEPMTLNDVGTYDCEVTDDCGTIQSDAVALNVPGSCTAPAISSQSGSQSVCRGGSVMLSVVAGGTGPFTYEWRRTGSALSDGTAADGTVVSGSAAATLSISSIAVSEAGTYDCLVRGACGNVSSTPVLLGVCVADFNCSGVVSPQDIFDFLAAWFAGDVRAHVNAAGNLTVQDIFDFLAAWFAGC